MGEKTKTGKKAKISSKPKSKQFAKNPRFLSVFEKHFSRNAVILICLIGFLVYSNTFYSEMQFDDTLQIVAKSRVNSLNNYLSIDDWLNVNKRPLAYFSFALNYYFGEYNVVGYHVVNLIIHLLTAILVFFLARMIFNSSPGKKPVINPEFVDFAALFTVLLFLCHPIQTQGVTYIVQRMTSMSAMFYILAVFLYAKGRIIHIFNGQNKAYLYYILTIFAGLFSLLSKQIAVTLPFALLLFEYFFIRDKDGNRFTKYLLFGFVSLAIGVLIVIFSGLIPRETQDISRQTYFITQSKVIIKYSQLMILPIGQNVDYDFPLSESIWGWKELLSSITIIGLLVFAIFIRNKRPVISFGMLWIFLMLSVESSIIPIRDVIFEHRLYLPMMGFALIVSVLIIQFLGKRSIRPVLVSAGAIILLLSITSFNRNKVWKTQYSLWEDIIQKSPDKYRPVYNLSKLYLDDKRYNDAVIFAKKTIELNPDFGDAYYIIAVSLEKSGKINQAIDNYKKAIELDSLNSKSMNNLGSIYIKQKNYSAALEYLKMALKRRSKQIPIYQNLGIAYYNLGDYNNAIKYNRKLMKLDPDNSIVLSDIGTSYMQLKQYNKAIECIAGAIKINPRQLNSNIDLGSCYFYLGDYKKAIEAYSAALKIDPNNTKAKQFLALSKSKLHN